MVKATTTIRQSLQYQPHQADWFAATQRLFNQVAAFYFQVIQAHEGVLDLPNNEALTALEKLTHATKKHPTPVGSRKIQVVGFPRSQKRKLWAILPFAKGMAPRKRQRAGMAARSPICFPHYAAHRVGARPRPLRSATTEACQKPLDFSPSGVSRNLIHYNQILYNPVTVGAS